MITLGAHNWAMEACFQLSQLEEKLLLSLLTKNRKINTVNKNKEIINYY